MAKIIHIITRMDMGGSAQNTLFTCLELAEKFQTLLVCGLSVESAMTQEETAVVNANIQKARKLGVRVIKTPWLVRNIYPLKDLLALFFLTTLLMREKPDIVHTHTSKGGLLGRIAAFAARVPVVIHTPHGHVFSGHFNKTASRFFLVLEKLAAKFTDHLIAISPGEKQDNVRLGVFPADKVSVIHSGVPIEKFVNFCSDKTTKKQSLQIPLNKPVVGSVGWLLPIKNPTLLLQAMESVWRKHDAQLVFVGKGELEEALRKQAKKMNRADSVTFLGWRNDVHEIIPLFDVFVLPSKNEGMGRVLVEAMAAAKPVCATRVGGIPDMVEEGKTGLLTAPDDENGLAQSIDFLLDNPDTAKNMGKNGLERCRQFGLEAMINKLDKLYQELLQNHGGQ